MDLYFWIFEDDDHFTFFFLNCFLERKGLEKNRNNYKPKGKGLFFFFEKEKTCFSDDLGVMCMFFFVIMIMAPVTYFLLFFFRII